MVLSQSRNIEDRLIGSKYPWKQPGLLLSLLQYSGYGDRVFFHLRLAFHVKGIIWVDSNLLEDDSKS